MRRLREARGLTQAQVADRMGTSQAWVARMESGAADAGMSAVRRYLDAIGAHLDVALDATPPPFFPMSLADLAATTRRFAGDGEAMLRLCLQFVDDFEDAGPDVQPRLLRARPGSTGDPRWDAFIGALAEHLAYHHGLPLPDWADRDDRFLRRSWFLSDLPSVRAAALAESPAAFRRRGVFVTADFFARA
jgi:transcriptional regulator with XRE-family HTH domain